MQSQKYPHYYVVIPEFTIMISSITKREDQTYTKCYCEENVWKLCDRLKQNGEHFDRAYAVFISNSEQTVPLWCQRASADPENKPVVWDYHVILLLKSSSVGSPAVVFDLDSSLDPFPCPADLYAAKTFPMEERLLTNYKRSFRVVSAAEFLLHFASDRSHMKDSSGNWLMPPPVYDCIQPEGRSPHNLDNFISMDKTVGWGQVMNLEDFVIFFRQ